MCDTSKQDKGKTIEDTEMEKEDHKIDTDDSGPYFDDFISPGEDGNTSPLGTFKT